MKKVGAVIVSYNSAGELKDCIESVKRQDSREIKTVPIVVDNNSGDSSISVSKNTGAITIPNSTNLGFSKAVNIGVSEAFTRECDTVLILNPDAVLQGGSLNSLVSTLYSDDNIAATGPLMIHQDGTTANEGYYLKAPSLITVAAFSTLLRPWSLKSKLLLRQYEEADLDEQKSVEQIPGACLLTSRRILEDVGMLDEDFAIWFEDVEWSYRARKHGYRLVFCPDARVVHEGGVSFSKWEGLEKSVTFYVSMKTFFRKHKPLSYPLVVLVLCLNALASYMKSRDRNQLRFIKRFITQKVGQLPS